MARLAEMAAHLKRAVAVEEDSAAMAEGAARIAAGVGKLGERDAERISRATREVGPLPQLNVRGTSIARRLHSDKKTRNGKVHFVLPTEIGKVEVVNDVPEEVVRAVVEEIRELSHRAKSS